MVLYVVIRFRYKKNFIYDLILISELKKQKQKYTRISIFCLLFYFHIFWNLSFYEIVYQFFPNLPNLELL